MRVIIETEEQTEGATAGTTTVNALQASQPSGQQQATNAGPPAESLVQAMSAIAATSSAAYGSIDVMRISGMTEAVNGGQPPESLITAIQNASPRTQATGGDANAGAYNGRNEMNYMH